jgi:hypothetical protein
VFEGELGAHLSLLPPLDPAQRTWLTQGRAGLVAAVEADFWATGADTVEHEDPSAVLEEHILRRVPSEITSLE